MNIDRLFDTVTLELLDDYGYVFTNSGTTINFENSFFIFDADHPNIRTVHRKYMIDDVESDFKSKYRVWYDSQTVFEKYRNFRAETERGSSMLPRKPVTVPPSQFDNPDTYTEDDDEIDEQFSLSTDRRSGTVHIRVRGKDQEELAQLGEWQPDPLLIS